MKILTLVFVFILALSAFGQNAPAPSTKSVPEPLPLVQWEKSPDCKICDSVTVEGDTYRILLDGNITLAVNIGNDNSYWLATVFLINNGQSKFDFDPLKNAAVVAWKTKEGFIHETEKPEFIPAADPVKIVKKMQRRIAWANALSAFGAGMQRQTTTVNSTTSGTASVYGSGGSATGIYNGQSTSTVQSPNVEAQRQTQNQAARNNARVAATGNKILDDSLKANTLFQNGKVFGEIYYQRKKKFDVLDFRFIVNGKIYSFIYNAK